MSGPSASGKSPFYLQENTQLQNKVTEMAEKLSASEEMVLELQKELNRIVKDKVTFSCCSQMRTFQKFIKKIGLAYFVSVAVVFPCVSSPAH